MWEEFLIDFFNEVNPQKNSATEESYEPIITDIDLVNKEEYTLDFHNIYNSVLMINFYDESKVSKPYIQHCIPEELFENIYKINNNVLTFTEKTENFRYYKPIILYLPNSLKYKINIDNLHSSVFIKNGKNINKLYFSGTEINIDNCNIENSKIDSTSTNILSSQMDNISGCIQSLYINNSKIREIEKNNKIPGATTIESSYIESFLGLSSNYIRAKDSSLGAILNYDGSLDFSNSKVGNIYSSIGSISLNNCEFFGNIELKDGEARIILPENSDYKAKVNLRKNKMKIKTGTNNYKIKAKEIIY